MDQVETVFESDHLLDIDKPKGFAVLSVLIFIWGASQCSVLLVARIFFRTVPGALTVVLSVSPGRELGCCICQSTAS